MRLILITIGVIFGIGISTAYSQSWTFLGHAGGSGNDYGDRVALDGNDNSYVIGAFEGSAKFDTISLVAPGHWNIYLAKYDPRGRIIWAKVVAYTTATGSDIFANAIALDAAGNIYIGGRFLTDITIAGVKRESLGSSDMYLIKLNPDGNPIWSRTPGGVGIGSFGQDAITALALDSAGNCYITGHYNNDAQFDTISLTSTLYYEAFIAKYDSSGKALWARSGSSYGQLRLGLGIAVDKGGNSYVTGRFFNTLTFGADTCDAVDGEQKAFITKMSTDGVCRWIKKVGDGGYYGAGNDVAVDGDGNVYLAGFFRSSINFGTTTYTYDNNNRYAALIVKYDRDGHYVWSARSEGGDQHCTASEVKVDNAGNVVVVGSFTGPATFGATHLTGSADKSNAFIAELNQHGDYIRAAQVTGNAGVTGSSCVLTSNGDCEITGIFSDSIVAGSYSARGAGGVDMFLAKFSLTGLSVDTFVPRSGDELLLYPNPASGIVRLIGGQPKGRVRIYSSDGVLLIDLGSTDRIDVSHFPAGAYFVQSSGLSRTLIKIGAGENP
ncbi:MAG: hypothetical protein JWQ98_1097 [Chlorobi bacterium]|nr:hypothetical protein [Chlorobiota bacterium]